jgi:SAM-dependent methyltransferase
VSVAAHLAVAPAAYDSRIRALIPSYDELIAEAARALHGRRARSIVDLGIGTGALAQACLGVARAARVWGIDADADMMQVARARLRRWRRRVTFVHGDFRTATLPRCDAIVASYALHHIRHRREKATFYRRCREALRPGGVLVSGDCMPATQPSLVARDLEHWFAHLARTAGSRATAKRIYESWADEDTYMPLSVEVGLLERAGFVVEIPWRRSPFAVVAGVRRA